MNFIPAAFLLPRSVGFASFSGRNLLNLGYKNSFKQAGVQMAQCEASMY